MQSILKEKPAISLSTVDNDDSIMHVTPTLRQPTAAIIAFLLVIVQSVTKAVAEHTIETKQSSDKNHQRRRDPLDRPNFVLLFVDDLGYADCGFSGHPTTRTPHIDRLAFSGKILTTWYSGCNVCTCSRAALMTGRQYPRTGVAEVFGPTGKAGLPLEEITIAEQLKQHANYTTAIVGKWHLGQRLAYLPGNQGFDYYLGIPYSDDMGAGKLSTCQAGRETSTSMTTAAKRTFDSDDDNNNNEDDDHDDAQDYLPLVYQKHNRTKIVEQPLDLTTLSHKYNLFATQFIESHQEEPFFLFVPFSHVHTTSGRNEKNEQLPNEQYSSCEFRNTSQRGAFGDALAEIDWMVGNIHKTLQKLGLEENTLILFTSDNGPWNAKREDGGSFGIFNGLFAGYPWTGKGSTWEGGIREPAFAYWKGQIEPFSRSSETISSMDVFPTFSHLAGVSNPHDTVLDGRNMADILLRENGKSQHDFLFLYGSCWGQKPEQTIKAVRHGPYKAHFCTSPGLGGKKNNATVVVYKKYPLLFNIDQDPSEAYPLCTGDKLPYSRPVRAAIQRILRAYAMEKATFEYGHIPPLPPGPGEGPNRYGLCCNRTTHCFCDASDETTTLWDDNIDDNDHILMSFRQGIFHVGTRQHHSRYHESVGEENHMHAQ